MKSKAQKKSLARLVQLPAPPPAARGATGNAALSPGCLAVAAVVEGVADKFVIDVVPPGIADTLGDAALVEHIVDGGPAVVGFSFYMWNSERSLHIAREIKRRLPDAVIVVGGPEVHADNTFLLKQTGFDAAVAGEGERTFARILSSIARREFPAKMPSTSVRGRNGLGMFMRGEPAGFPLGKYPSPYLAGVIPIDKRTSVYVETARGCSAGCSFCFYSRGHAVVRRLEVEQTKNLLSNIALSGATSFTILDPSFNLRPDFDELLAAIASLNRKRKLSFFAEIRAEVLNERQMDMLAKAGFTKLEIGLQSVNRKTLRRIQRGGNPTAIIEAARKLKERGIALLVDLMVGLPGDSRKDVLMGVEKLCDAGLGEYVQILPLSVLPGTAIRENAGTEGIVFDEAPPYRVRRTSTMTEEDVAESILQAEELLGRRVDEYPRPFLAEHGVVPDISIRHGVVPMRCRRMRTSGATTSSIETKIHSPDIIRINLDDSAARVVRIASSQGASHVALWFDGTDLFARRDVICRAIKARIATDPYCVLDIVLVTKFAFPLDLIDMVRNTLAEGPEWYLTRHLAFRGENAARRICAVIPRNVRLPDDYVQALIAELPVFRDMTLDEALESPERLGNDIPGARIIGETPRAGCERLKQLAQRADPEAVSFASRELEAWWVTKSLS